jgi:small GTP-binding protein
MDKLKVCMIGGTAVGKTSLVARFVDRVFEERYTSTIGVRIQARHVQRSGRPLTLVLWDLSGEDEFQGVQPSYLRGMAGYLLVVDGTRRQTLLTAIALEARVRATVGPLPFVVVLNKSDRIADWDLSPELLERLTRLGGSAVRTSAKTGENVDEAFHQLADQMLRAGESPWTAMP